MRISHVEAHAVRIPPPTPPFGWRRGLLGGPPGGEGAVLRIVTDDGVEGVALVPRRGAGAIVRDLVDGRPARRAHRRRSAAARMAVASDVGDRPHRGVAHLHPRARRHRAVGPRRARRRAPGWQLLGGFREAIPAYASTATFASTEEYLDVASQCLELGYPAIKLHAWGDARADAGCASPCASTSATMWR